MTFLCLLVSSIFGQIISNMNDWTLSVETSSEKAEIFRTVSEEGKENSSDMRELFLKVPVTDAEQKELEVLQREDGSFSDIDYRDSSKGCWQPSIHCFRVQRLAIRYVRTSDAQSLDLALKAMRYWHSNTPVCRNWWHNEIGVPRLMGPAYLLLLSKMTPDDAEGAKTVLGCARIHKTGQNKVWLAGVVLTRALIEKDSVMLATARDAICGEIKIGERGVGIQPDYSFHQHGRQLQFGNYGLSYAVSLSYWSNILNGTAYAFPADKIELLEKYIKNGLGQVVHNGWFDHNACGRQVFRNAQLGKAICVSQAAANMKVEIPYGPGGIYYPYSDFVIYRGAGWYASLRMQTRHLKGFEMTNKENMQGYFSSDGCLLTRRVGDEYRDISAVWNWRHVPGATTWDDGTALWGGEKGRADDDVFYNDSDSISVREYENGNMAVAMEYRRDGLQARKAWFFFEGGVVCLGAGICDSLDVNVLTAIDQKIPGGRISCCGNCVKCGNESYVVLDGKLVNASGPHSGSWSKIAPQYPESAENMNLLDIYIDHGRFPKNATYAYVVLEDASVRSCSQARKYVKDRIVILQNTPDRQAVSINGVTMEMKN